MGRSRFGLISAGGTYYKLGPVVSLSLNFLLPPAPTHDD
jgi:hypothetical protein